MEEVVGKIDSFRRNLMGFSFIAILLAIFGENIKEINILGIIHLKGINNITFLLTFIGIQFYSLFRYYTYFIKINFRLNFDLLFSILLKGHKGVIKKITCNHKDIDIKEITFRRDGNINTIHPLLRQQNILNAINPFFGNKNNFCDMYKTDKDRVVRCRTLIEGHSDLELKIHIPKYSLKVLYILSKIYILEKNILDYIGPMVIGSITILIICYKAITL